MSVLRIPAYRLQKSRGLAVVTLSGQDVYLGKYGTPESKEEYERRVAEWLARGRTVLATATVGPSVNEVMLAYLQFAETYYRDADGNRSREIETMSLAFRPLKALYGHRLTTATLSYQVTSVPVIAR